MRYRLLSTFLWAGAIYLTVVRFYLGIVSNSVFGINILLLEYCKGSPVITLILGDYSRFCSIFFSVPILIVLVPQIIVCTWLFDGNDTAYLVTLLGGGVFWGFVFSRQEYLKLKKKNLKLVSDKESSTTPLPHNTKKMFLSFWIGFLSVEVVSCLRTLIALLLGIKLNGNTKYFDEIDCSWSSTIDNLLSFTPVYCTARKYFSKYVDPLDSFRSDSGSYKDPSRLESYFGHHNAATFFGDCILWGLIFAGLYFIAFKLWSLLRPPSEEPQTNLNDQRIP
jgi:hypothetical protein